MFESFPGKFRIHAVTGPEILERPDFLELARKVAAAGLAAVNLRAHGFEGRKLFELARTLRELTSAAGVPLIITDRLDVALAVEADAVNLGAHSIPLQAAAPLCRERKIAFGCSCHSLGEALEARKQGAAYIYLGTVFPSRSKPRFIGAGGVGLLEQVCSEVDIPVFGIGGIDCSNAAQVFSAGAFGLAAITAVWESIDITGDLGRLAAQFDNIDKEKFPS